MSWSFLDLTPILGIRIANALLGFEYPQRGELEATLDTGYEGFLLIPPTIFERLKFNELKLVKRVLVTADRRTIETVGAFGTVKYPPINYASDGLIETNPDIEEILLGMKGISGLLVAMNTCRKLTWTIKC